MSLVPAAVAELTILVAIPSSPSESAVKPFADLVVQPENEPREAVTFRRHLLCEPGILSRRQRAVDVFRLDLFAWAVS